MPYNPGVVDRSGEILAGGISRGVDDIMAGFEKMKAEQKRVLDGGKIADSIVKTYPEILDSLGMQAESFQALGAKEKALRVQGAIMGAGYKKAQQDMELLRDRIDSQRRDRKLADQAVQSYLNGPPIIAPGGGTQESPAPFPESLDDYHFTLDPSDRSRQPAMSSDRLDQLLVRPGADAGTNQSPNISDILERYGMVPNPAPAGYVPDRHLLDQMSSQNRMRYALRNTPMTSGALEEFSKAVKSIQLDPGVSFNEDPVTGSRFATYGNSLARSGVNPSKLVPKPETAQSAARARYYDTAGDRELLKARVRELQKVDDDLWKLTSKPPATENSNLGPQMRALKARKQQIESEINDLRRGGGRSTPAPDRSTAAMDTAQSIKDAYKSGKMKRDEALRRLQALGMKQ